MGLFGVLGQTEVGYGQENCSSSLSSLQTKTHISTLSSMAAVEILNKDETNKQIFPLLIPLEFLGYNIADCGIGSIFLSLWLLHESLFKALV